MDVDERLRTLLQGATAIDTRLMCIKDGNSWRIRRIRAKVWTSEPAMPGQLEYPAYLFLRVRMDVDDFLAFLEMMRSPDEPCRLAGRGLYHPPLNAMLDQHFRGHTQWGMESSPLPTWRFTGHWQFSGSPLYENEQDPLIGIDGAPYFPRVIDAAAWYLFERGMSPHSSNLPDMGMVIEDSRAYFTGIDIEGDTYTVRCDGAQLTQCQLQLYTSAPQVLQQPAQSQSTFKIEGEPHTISIVLTHEGDWLDRRDISLSGLGRQSSEDVRWADEELGLKELIARRGESADLEFKEHLTDGPHEKDRFLQSVVAFANTRGGTILVGVADDGQIVGTGPGDTKERVLNKIEDRISGVPLVTTHYQDVDGQQILVVEVAEGTGKPYALIINSNQYKYYVRRDGSNKQMKPEDFRLTLSPAEQAGPFQPPFSY